MERLNAARPLRALPGPGRAAFAFPEAPVSGRDCQCPAGRPVPPARQGPWGGAVLLRPLDVDRDKVRYPSLCRPPGRREAGCPSGQRERSVKPSASPTLVRIQDLPPPAETAPDQRGCGQELILSCVTGCGSGCPYAARCAKYVPKFGEPRLLIIYWSSRDIVASSIRRRPAAGRRRCGQPTRRPAERVLRRSARWRPPRGGDRRGAWLAAIPPPGR